MPTPSAVAIELSDEERGRVEAWSRRRKTGQALALGSRIVLAAAGGAANYEIAEQLGVSRPTVTKWRNRFAERRLEGLLDEPRPGRPRTVTDETVERIVTTTLESTPKDATHWSTRSLAKHLGVSADAVWRTWQAFSLQPHRQEKFTLSTDPQFVEKVYDVCGLYLKPARTRGGVVRGSEQSGRKTRFGLTSDRQHPTGHEFRDRVGTCGPFPISDGIVRPAPNRSPSLTDSCRAAAPRPSRR